MKKIAYYILMASLMYIGMDILVKAGKEIGRNECKNPI